MKADYPLSLTNSVDNELQNSKDHGDESFLIFSDLLRITKPFIFIEIPYCKLNETKSKHFLKKFRKFSINDFRVVITWKTRNMQPLFKR